MQTLPSNYTRILDKGYCGLVDVMGDDKTVVNASRCSFGKKIDVMSDKDVKLLSFLAKNEHTAPFRHAMLQFEISVPLMVARQHFKHCIGSGFQDPMLAWNEISHRYVTETEEFYVPNSGEWRKAPNNKKQGSGENFTKEEGIGFTIELENHINRCQQLYKDMLALGIAPEQARIFLPAYALYIKYYWTCSLQAALHFLELRLDNHAQYEIRQLAIAVAEFVKQKFPESYNAWLSKDQSQSKN